MSYNNPLVNFAGGTINTNYFSNTLTKQQADNNYVNEKGDSMKVDLDMKNNKIINVQDPKDLQDVTTKRYTDSNFATIFVLNNTVKNIPIKLKQFFLDSTYKIKYELLPAIKDVVYKDYLFNSNNKKIKYELLPEKDISLNTNKLIKESFQSFIKIIYIIPKTYLTEITYINDNGIILQNTNISNIYHKPKGNIISIQLIEYEKDTNVWWDNKSDDLKKYIRVENGYLLYLGSRDNRLTTLTSSGRLRIYVLMSPLSITVETIPKITVEIPENQNLGYTITAEMGLL